MAATIELTDEQQLEIAFFIRSFPYRIVWGMFDKDTGKFFCTASHNRRAMNKEARKGHTVFEVKRS